jgi:hypothetical protein
MRFRSLAALALIATFSSACYRVTVVTGAAPAATTVDKPWVNSFLWGLVPPQPINVAAQCPGGVSKVVTERSFLNGLVAAVQSSILFGVQVYTPMHVNVTCGTRR